MIDVETLIGRVWELEGKYDQLLRNHQSLIHEFEILKEKYENLQKVQSRVESDGVCEG